MALWSGIDTVAIVSLGVYSETYSSSDASNVAYLFASRGLLEEGASAITTASIGSWLLYFFRHHIKR